MSPHEQTLPPVVSRDAWTAARKALLAREKEATRARDALSAARRELPMVRIERDYVFHGPAGPASLLDLFEGRRQLVVHHFMFDPSWEDGCPSCTFFEDDRPPLEHLHDKDISYAVISRAPMERIEAYRAKRGWDSPWYSSYGSDFNYDFHVTLDEAVAPVEYNYRSKAEYERRADGPVEFLAGEQPGVSVFLRDGDEVFHTYSAFARGVELLVPSAGYYDLTPLGRQDGST